MTTTVLIADDQALVRDGIRMILQVEPAVEVIGEAGDGHEAVALARELQPAVVLMDIRMPGLDGIEATRQIMRGQHSTRVLVLTTYDADELLYTAMRAGASGFLLKDVRRESLVHAIRTVALGEALVHPAMTRRLLDEFTHRPPPGATPAGLERLTDRELEVLRLIARGQSNAELAHSLHVSEATVKTHVGQVMRKLGLRDRVQVVVTAYESGLVRPGQR
jgi:DNA-binding NarL/FixJ family response regulator